MNDGFRAANGSIYRPNVVRMWVAARGLGPAAPQLTASRVAQVRIGSGDARLSDRARDVWVEAMVKQYLSAADTSSVAAKLEEKRRCSLPPPPVPLGSPMRGLTRALRASLLFEGRWRFTSTCSEIAGILRCRPMSKWMRSPKSWRRYTTHGTRQGRRLSGWSSCSVKALPAAFFSGLQYPPLFSFHLGHTLNPLPHPHFRLILQFMTPGTGWVPGRGLCRLHAGQEARAHNGPRARAGGACRDHLHDSVF